MGVGVAAGGALLVYTVASANPRPGMMARDRTPGAAIPNGVPGCVATAKLIPSCGAWWGVAPDVFGGRPPARALAAAEKRMGRKADIVHVYHRGGEPFPTPEERQLAKTRLLLINWKPSVRHTWAQIAGGAIDRRIDRVAASLRRMLPDRFFLTVHHEPENDVRPGHGSGMTADDYASMYRHVVLRLRERGVRNAVTVMTYMGAPNWAAKPWFERLYPGDDVVDWIGLDPYADRRVDDFATLVDKVRRDHAAWPGFYRWTQARFPGKPIMVAEWGAFERPDDPAFKVEFFNSVRRQIRGYPQIKALVYFDSPIAPRGDTRFDATAAAGRAFTELARAPYFSSTPVPGR
ncbi:glycosyl hydrolase [Sphaerisporangium sp. TRM90804]|uniref:glycoside hydrolase family 26 protein n=1 Tax=Sphaerisporangium sp. TRM90804 TaxID=3031113 RepID=UPI00244D50CA|nr:glycosyl hydrolase [Sphaerisporangium sp. TRM90804]MDH2428757.1 glycosyl hydrolase [Sphaerisporangium sp. TRM90804]